MFSPVQRGKIFGNSMQARQGSWAYRGFLSILNFFSVQYFF